MPRVFGWGAFRHAGALPGRGGYGHEGWTVLVEGHTDHQGSDAYNLKLGEQRAETARQALVAQGVAGSRIDTVSYGEERLARQGETLADHAKNRRVVIVCR